MKPGILYGMIYNSCHQLVKLVITCKEPNTSPDTKIKRISLEIIFRIPLLNTNSSWNGAIKTAVIKV